MNEGIDGLSITTQMGEALVARMVRLERKTRTLARLSTILGFGVLASLALALASLSSAGFFSGDRTLTAQRVLLRDATGFVRGTWQIAEDGSTQLQLQDRNGIARVKLSVLDTGDPGVALSDPKGRTRIVLGLLPGEGGTLAFADESGNTRAVLGMGADDATTLVFVDAFGTTRAGLGVSGDGDPSFTLYEDARSAPVRQDTASSSEH